MVQPEEQGGEGRAVSRSWEACGAVSGVLRCPEECVLEERGDVKGYGHWPPVLTKDTNLHIEEVPWSPGGSEWRPTQRHSIITWSKPRGHEHSLRAAQEAAPGRVLGGDEHAASFSSETGGQKELEKGELSTEILYLVKLSLRSEGEMKTCPDKFRIKDRGSSRCTHTPARHCTT